MTPEPDVEFVFNARDAVIDDPAGGGVDEGEVAGKGETRHSRPLAGGDGDGLRPGVGASIGRFVRNW